MAHEHPYCDSCKERKADVRAMVRVEHGDHEDMALCGDCQGPDDLPLETYLAAKEALPQGYGATEHATPEVLAGLGEEEANEDD